MNRQNQLNTQASSHLNAMHRSGRSAVDELATLIDSILLGHYVAMSSVAGASRSLELIGQLLPKEAHKVVGATVNDVAIDKLFIY